MALNQFNAPQDRAPSEFLWFVYGSTLDFDALRAWCTEHGYRVPDLANAKPAKLPGQRLAFNVRSNFWGGVVASLLPQDGAHVEGVVIPMPAEGLGFVKHKEGVLSGLFEERAGTCIVAGEEKPCRYYVAAENRVVPEADPASRFLDTILKGARERGLSAEWIARLQALRK